MQTTILVVDDHHAVRRSLREWLEMTFSQCSIIEAVSGEEAVAMAQSNLPRVVIMDIGLPGMSGIESVAAQAAIVIENARLFETEREQFRRLQESQAQLIQAEKMGALGRLAASIVHEINNPLQAIQNNLEKVELEMEGTGRPEKILRYVSRANNEVGRLGGIVRRLRDFYRPAH